MSTNAGWNRTAQLQLISELKGFWAGDLWDMHHSPVKDLSPNAKQRRLRFLVQVGGAQRRAAEVPLLEEILWRRMAEHSRKSPRVHRMIHWLNSMRTLPSSLLQKDFSAWRDLYRAYLSELGQYKTGTTSRMDGEQRPQVTGRDSAFISTLLRQACIPSLDRPTIFALISRKTSGI